MSAAALFRIRFIPLKHGHDPAVAVSPVAQRGARRPLAPTTQRPRCCAAPLPSCRSPAALPLSAIVFRSSAAPIFLQRRTKKVGIVGKYGTRFGASLRK